MATTGSPNTVPHSPKLRLLVIIRLALVALRDQLEEQVRRVQRERQVVQLVDDQQLQLGVERQGSSSRASACALASVVKSVVAGANSTE